MEKSLNYSGHLVCVRSLFVGFLVALLTFIGALGLGLAFGGIGLADGASATNAGLFSGFWFALSAVLSVCVGSFFAVRLGRFENTMVAAGHGIVIASVFVLMVVSQSVSAIGWLTGAAADAAGGTAMAVGSGVSSLSQNAMVRDLVEDSLGDLKIADVQTVIPGLTSRLLRGDNEGAKNYLAVKAGKTPAEVDQKIAQLKTAMDQAMVKAREATATALKATGWSLFLMSLLCAVTAAMGGVWAAMRNARRPLIEGSIAPSNLYVGARV